MFGLDTIVAMNSDNPESQPKASYKRTDGRRRPALSPLQQEQRIAHELHRAGFRTGKREGLIVALGVVQSLAREAPQSWHLDRAENLIQRHLARNLP